MKLKKNSYLDCFCIHIAEFCIELNFARLTELKVKKPLIQNIYYHFTKYLTGACNHDIDYRITFIESKDVPIIGKKKKMQMDYYMHLFSKKDHTLYVNHYIGIEQLQLILKIVVQNLLLKSGGFYFHASSVLNDKRLLLFTGLSGAGKSTIASKLNSLFPQFSDDVIIIKKIKNQWWGYQMTLENIILNKNKTTEGFVIDSVSFISKSENLKIIYLKDNQDILEKMIQQISGGTIYKKHLKDLISFIKSVKIYTIAFPLNLNAGKFKKEFTKLRSAAAATTTAATTAFVNNNR